MSTAGLPEKPLLRADEVAKIFSVSIRTVYSWHQEGRIDAVKLPGGGIRIPRTCVIRIISESTE